MERTILHINIVNFYIAVAQAQNPKLRSYPVGVATVGSQRRVLLDISSRAWEAGLHRGMLLDAAKRRCADLVVLDPAPYAYGSANRALISEASRFSPLVEPAGPGHVFVDLTGTCRLLGRSIDVADRVRKEIRGKFNLDNAIGLATSKLVSKVATRVIKPAGLCSVMAGCEETFMAPLPLRLMPGIDSKVIQHLYQFNLRYINEIHTISPDLLVQALGSVAYDICRYSRGIDTVPVRELQCPEPSIEERITFKEQTNDDTVIQRELFGLVIRVGIRLRKQGFAARKLHLGITYYDGSQTSRTVTLRVPLNGDLSLFEQFNAALAVIHTRRVRLSSIEISLRELSYPYGQLDLFENTAQEGELMMVLDKVRNKFGVESVRFGGIPGKR
jgi:DNA polymerase-4